MKKSKLAAIITVCLTLTSSAALAATPLEKEITTHMKQFNGTVGVYAKNLNTGKTFEYNEDMIFPTASTSKLLVALATYKYLYPKATTYRKAQYDEDIDLMMRISDNNSFDRLLQIIDTEHKDALDKVENDLRLRKTEIHDNQVFKKYHYHSVTSPYEMGKVFENIYLEKYLEKKQVKRLKYNLANTIFYDEIPRYMETPVYHKVGELDDVLCDVGVIQDGHDPILISFYTITADHDYSSNFIAKQSANLYNALRRK